MPSCRSSRCSTRLPRKPRARLMIAGRKASTSCRHAIESPHSAAITRSRSWRGVSRCRSSGCLSVATSDRLSHRRLGSTPRRLTEARHCTLAATKEVDMSSVEQMSGPAGHTAGSETTDAKLEVIVIPVSDVDRAKTFYAALGWRLDADFADGQGFRIVQFTPPGSACSIQFGSKITSAPLGSATNTYLVVP